jgi:hypothetical protein
MPAGATTLVVSTGPEPRRHREREAAMSRKVKWLGQPADEDYPKAANYLHLLVNNDAVAATIGALKAAPLSHQRATANTDIPVLLADLTL